MTKILRILATVFSCGACAAMIYFSSQSNNDAVYTCILLCIAGFFANMVITAHENTKNLEAQMKQQEKEQAQEDSGNNQ